MSQEAFQQNTNDKNDGPLLPFFATKIPINTEAQDIITKAVSDVLQAEAKIKKTESDSREQALQQNGDSFLMHKKFNNLIYSVSKILFIFAFIVIGLGIIIFIAYSFTDVNNKLWVIDFNKLPKNIVLISVGLNIVSLIGNAVLKWYIKRIN